MSDYSRHFIVRGKDVGKHARDYLSGLLGTEQRKNMERIHSDVAQSNHQAIQQFVSDSPWSDTAVMDQVAEEADGILGGHRHTALIIDETSFVKKGDSSVGVQRQYCGRLGKTENCQVGVFACLGSANKATVVDYRLYLPEAWTGDPLRCRKAKIPEDQREHRTKLELALGMVRRAKERGLRFNWVLADAAYGCCVDFCREVESLGYQYMMDLRENNCVWDADPLAVPEGGSKALPNPLATRLKAGDLVKAYFATQAREIFIRNTTKGELRARVWVRDVWIWQEGSSTSERRTLVAREHENGEIKISWTNAARGTAVEDLAYIQAQRHWIERAFQDAKSELGMAQYEHRKWRGWHHHMAMVSLGMLFVLKERMFHVQSAPLLSPRDIVELLAYYIPRRGGTEKEVFDDLVCRHLQRLQASNSHARQQRRRRRVAQEQAAAAQVIPIPSA